MLCRRCNEIPPVGKAVVFFFPEKGGALKFCHKCYDPDFFNYITLGIKRNWLLRLTCTQKTLTRMI